VLRLDWQELLFGEAERIMPQDKGVVSRKLLLLPDARGDTGEKLPDPVSRERFLHAEDGKACRALAAGPVPLSSRLLLRCPELGPA